MAGFDFTLVGGGPNRPPGEKEIPKKKMTHDEIMSEWELLMAEWNELATIPIEEQIKNEEVCKRMNQIENRLVQLIRAMRN